MAYQEKVIADLKAALTERFELNDQQKKVLHATKLLHLKNWQSDDAGHIGSTLIQMNLAWML